MIPTRSLSTVLIVLVFLSWPDASLFARTITVDDDGTAEYSTLQGAVEVAIEGDTVWVKAGTYNEAFLDVRRSIVLQGEGAEVTFLKCNFPQYSGGGTVLGIAFCNPKVDGFTFDGEGQHHSRAIAVGDGRPIITNNRIISNRTGIHINFIYNDPSKGLGVISGNLIANNRSGLEVDWPEYSPPSRVDSRWNWWGTRDITEILQGFKFLMRDSPSASLVQYEPYLEAPATKAVLEEGIHYNNFVDNEIDFYVDFGLGVGAEYERWGQIKDGMR